MSAAPSPTSEPSADEAAAPRTLGARVRDFVQTFWQLRTASRVFWICNIVYMLDGAAYFGILNVLTLYLGDTLHWADRWKHPAVSFMTGAVTLAGALLGTTADKLGVKRTLLVTIVLAIVGRGLLGAAPWLPGSDVVVWVALLLMGISAGVMTPAVYTGVKQATTKENATIAFSLLYALMNGGSLIETYLSPLLRDSFRAAKLPTGESLEYAGVLWVCGGLGFIYLFVQLLGFPRGEGGPVVAAPTVVQAEKTSWRDHALLNPRFQFFIFILLGVRTLFAHQWLTMPDYMSRAFDKAVADRYEWVLSINPFIILFGTPILAAVTRRVHVVNMMIAGTLVSAAATFFLVPGPNFDLLLAYEVVFSLGEALWSSRFLEYVADVAPPDKVGLYMGVAQIPWFLAKTTTGLYSGFLLEKFCPPVGHGEQATGTLWLIYGIVGMMSPVGLFLARNWLKRGTLGAAPATAEAK